MYISPKSLSITSQEIVIPMSHAGCDVPIVYLSFLHDNQHQWDLELFLSYQAFLPHPATPTSPSQVHPTPQVLMCPETLYTKHYETREADLDRV